MLLREGLAHKAASKFSANGDNRHSRFVWLEHEGYHASIVGAMPQRLNMIISRASVPRVARHRAAKQQRATKEWLGRQSAFISSIVRSTSAGHCHVVLPRHVDYEVKTWSNARLKAVDLLWAWPGGRLRAVLRQLSGPTFLAKQATHNR